MSDDPAHSAGRDVTGVAEPAPVATEVPWRRLDGKMLVVAPLQHVVRLLPVLVILLFTGRGDPVRLWITLGITVLLVVLGVVRWKTTRYRITADRVELHSGWVRRQRRSVPRDRLRTVDVTSTLLHRVFTLGVLHVRGASSASADHHGLKLDAVSAAEATRLRTELLQHGPAPARVGGRTVGGDPAEVVGGDGRHGDHRQSQVLSVLRWPWIRFAPLTFSALAGTGVLVAAVWNVISELGIRPRDLPFATDVADRVRGAAIWLTVGFFAVTLLVVAVVGSLLMFTERWWGYRLTRDDEGTLRVHRGLLTRRSLSVAGTRRRGAAVSEPLLLRAGRGGQTRVLATGLGRGSQGGAVQPAASRRETHALAALLVEEPVERATLAPVLRHPRKALWRRLTRAVVPALVVCAAGWVVAGTVPGWAWLGPLTTALPVLAVPVAFDRYRNLGHLLTGRHLVTRWGSLHRRTVVLERDGVIGWRLRQSAFQRRAGLVTVEAVTAAGEGGYTVTDVAGADGVALAAAVTPGVVAGLRSAAPGTEQAAGDLATQGARRGPQERLDHR
ncbi:PH domain-containing protein [Pseudonocardia sp. N23]|uniref:PH domain-containing protein n=1 Tax=Pseudonocardia sp. N23 TaxID=1987376 RepID=UPI000BFCAD24|nr:PH domain-containing protein [Pseudonocardia sp. N23]